MDLLKIWEQKKLFIKEHNTKKEELERQKEYEQALSSIQKAIIDGKDETGVSNKDVLDEIGIKYKKGKSSPTMYEFCYQGHRTQDKYIFKINKTNIQKIQKYLDIRGK